MNRGLINAVIEKSITYMTVSLNVSWSSRHVASESAASIDPTNTWKGIPMKIYLERQHTRSLYIYIIERQKSGHVIGHWIWCTYHTSTVKQSPSYGFRRLFNETIEDFAVRFSHCYFIICNMATFANTSLGNISNNLTWSSWWHKTQSFFFLFSW